MSAQPSSPPRAKKDRAGPLFSDVVYFISPTLTQDAQANIASLLTVNGATRARSAQDASHIISDTDTFEGWRKASKTAEVVTPFWVERSVVLDTQQNPKGFSSDPRLIFSGIVASSVDLPEGDKETMRASIIALGGQWREMLTRDVTHLFCLTTKSEKYHKAMSYRAQSHMRVLLPHWFDDSFNARRLVPYDVYLFPNPPLFDKTGGIDALVSGVKGTTESAASKEILFKTAIMGSDDPLEDQVYSSVNVWQGRRVYLAKSLDLHGGRRSAVETMLKQGGAQIVDSDDHDEHELSAVGSCDVLVTRHREGKAFEQALREEKVIGSLSWVLHVQHQGKYSSPLDQLLHFPLPKWTIPGMEVHKISITNYSGAGRDYLRKLVEVVGANFTSTLSAANTLVIAASLNGKKTTKARDWDIPIVNHIWLEDCFAQWRLLSPAREKYIRFPHRGDMNANVGECGLGKYTLEDWKEAKKQHAAVEKAMKSDDATPRNGDKQEARDSRDDPAAEQTPRRPPVSRSSDNAPPATLPNASEADVEMLVDRESPFMQQPLDLHFDPVPPSSSPVRPPSSKVSVSTSKRHLDETGDRTPSAGPSKRPRLNAAESPVPPAIAPHTLHKPVLSEGHPDDDNNLRHDIPPRTPSPSRPGKIRDRDDFGLERMSSLTPPSSSIKRGKQRENSQDVVAEALSPLTNVARARQMVEATERSSAKPIDDEEEDPHRRRSGRAAAAKATKTLKEVVMPDVLRFETQEKRGKRNVDEDNRGAPVAKTSSKKTPAPRRTKSKSTEVDEDDEPMIVDAPTTRGKREPQTPHPTRNIFYIATQTSVSESDQKILASLGARPAGKTDKCTHLIANSIVRTQKFLIAINNAPYIISRDWVDASVHAKCLMPEQPYALNHPDGEQKYGFKLADALDRAKKNKGALLKGCTFYVTDNAVSDHDLVKAVVKAAGGEVKRKIPNLRQAQHENVYIISHTKDEAQWRPLSRQGIQIYNSDLVLNGVLRQTLPTDDPACWIAESD